MINKFLPNLLIVTAAIHDTLYRYTIYCHALKHFQLKYKRIAVNLSATPQYTKFSQKKKFFYCVYFWLSVCIILLVQTREENF